VVSHRRSVACRNYAAVESFDQGNRLNTRADLV
jgi:hypothetical protein